MSSSNQKDFYVERISRRHFVQVMAATGALAAMGGNPISFGEETPQKPAELSGTQFELTIDKLPVNFTGHRRTALGINGSSPPSMVTSLRGGCATAYAAG